MHVPTKGISTNINTRKSMADEKYPGMHKLEIYERDKNGNRGKLITTSWYPSKEQADVARRAVIWLCINQWKFPKEWTLKSCIAVKS